MIGPGVLSRALLELPKERVSKLVVLEDEPFLQALLVRFLNAHGTFTNHTV